MSHTAPHSHKHTNKENLLFWALIITSSYLIIEVAGGILTGSLALISDAAHMLTDVSALLIAWIAIKIGQKPADQQRTFGYYRFEILATAFNTLLLFFVALYIVYEAYQRFYHPPEIYSFWMFIIAILGLFVNLTSMRLLSSPSEKSMVIQSAYYEVWSDMLGSVGVILGSLIIYFTNWTLADSIVAVLIGLWVLPRTWVILKESMNILLESVPSHIDVNQVVTAMKQVEGVLDIHDLHIWGITNDIVNLTAHVVIDRNHRSETIISNLQIMLKTQFSIGHTTFQQEWEPCMEELRH